MKIHRSAAHSRCKAKRFAAILTASLALGCGLVALGGCSDVGGYSSETLFPDTISTVRVEMFDNRSFRRGVEYDLSDALAKRIEVETPYKIVSDNDRADSVLGGQLTFIGESTLTTERATARPLEREVILTAVVNWKDLKTGRMMINSEIVTATASYSSLQDQDFTYASSLAANRLARRIVERMEEHW